MVIAIVDGTEEGARAAPAANRWTWRASGEEGRTLGELLGDPDRKALLEKWDVLRGVRIRLFRFDERFDAAAASVPQTTAFLQSLLSSDVFASGFADVVPSKLDLGADAYEVVASAAVDMGIFDVWRDRGVVRPNGSISMCPDCYLDDGVVAQNELQRALYDEESQAYGSVDDHEFIVQLMQMMVLGGPLCQFEDTIQPYLDVVKAFYKYLMNVVKTANDTLQITSKVYRIRDGRLFASPPSPWNRLYVIVDASRRHASVLYFPRGNTAW
ncbi:unnamed protein product (mitochondrion) [Plasmodiophora brassicae]|uniref:Cilia- and flagella-associated protein 300 n=1 Tax=Plasmodiophora brassicae TaxID=37360 RepID=A0A0G4IVE5_PLABS|nr:hypothetical protein PBRA_007200 [Plasmodiophora brassicae]SPQ98639.1 unnamed protein product [Plasmodiophora brassicae]